MQVFKPRNNLIIRKQISVNLSAQDWGLHTKSFPRVVVERVADLLNSRFNHTYNKGTDKLTLVQHMHELMTFFGIYGANDSEPRMVLEQLCWEVYYPKN